MSAATARSIADRLATSIKSKESSLEAIRSFADLRKRARLAAPKRIALVAADDHVALTAIAAAMECGLAVPILIGDEPRIRRMISETAVVGSLQGAQVIAATKPAAEAVDMASKGAVDVILKGNLRTDELLHAILGEDGLRTGRLLSDVLLYEDTLSGSTRLVGITDGGLNVAPTFEQKRRIIENAIDVFHCLGFVRPKIAVMSATEAVSPAVPSTIDAEALTKLGLKGEFDGADVYGPLALDNALLEAAARAKGIRNPVAGHADCMVVPTIEAGNLLGKAVKYLGGSACAHVVVGAKVPILIPSRVEGADDKINAIALGVLYGSR